MKTGNSLLGVLMFVIVGAGLGLGFNALRPQPLPWVATPKTAVKLEDLSPPTASADPVTSPTSESNPASRSNTAAEMSATDGSDHGAAPAPVEAAPAETTTAKGTDRGATNGKAVADTGKTVPAKPASKITAEAVKKLYPDIPESDVPIDISLAKAKEFYDRGGLLVLDARDMDEYVDGHIMGALDAPYDDKVGDIQWLMDTAKDPRPILCYCNGGDCELSLDLGTEITRTGHKRVLILTDGYPGWRNAGYPIAPGKKP